MTLDEGRISSIEHHAVESDETPPRLALPPFADLHVHADRAFAPGTRPPRSLTDAVDLAREVKRRSSEEDVRLRATRLLGRALEHGTLRVRTHVDVDESIGERGLRGVLAARAAFSGKVDVEIVAFATTFTDPTTSEGEARMRAAVDAGADLLGAVPALHDDPIASLDRVLALAAELELPADLHVDETTSPDTFVLEALADLTCAHGLEGRVSASHACALASVDQATASRTIAKLAAARITVIALPALNLYLQGRGGRTPRVRGLTLVRELRAAGVNVRFGSDNVRDVFYPFGDLDPLESAWLAAIAAHLDDEDVLLAGICDGTTRLQVGTPAHFVLLDATSLTEAIARRPGSRTVVREGRIVAGPATA
jgi:cytosine deaminase